MSERARLAWRCRRGMLELDLLLGDFLAHGYGQLTVAQQALFRQLLEQPDQELLALLLGQQQAGEGAYVDLVAAIRRTAAS